MSVDGAHFQQRLSDIESSNHRVVFKCVEDVGKHALIQRATEFRLVDAVVAAKHLTEMNQSFAARAIDKGKHLIDHAPQNAFTSICAEAIVANEQEAVFPTDPCSQRGQRVGRRTALRDAELKFDRFVGDGEIERGQGNPRRQFCIRVGIIFHHWSRLGRDFCRAIEQHDRLRVRVQHHAQ